MMANVTTRNAGALLGFPDGFSDMLKFRGAERASRSTAGAEHIVVTLNR